MNNTEKGKSFLTGMAIGQAIILAGKLSDVGSWPWPVVFSPTIVVATLIVTGHIYQSIGSPKKMNQEN